MKQSHGARDRMCDAKRTLTIRLGALAFALVLTGIACPAQTPSARREMRDTTAKLTLREGWRLQSSARLASPAQGQASGSQAEPGALISTAAFDSDAKSWYPTVVPSTVVAALVKNNVLPDPNFGTNIRSFPGVSYAVGTNFANQPMPADSPFNRSWWYRTEFRLPVGDRGKRTRLHFDGLNFRANIWLNGRKIADAQDTAGTFRRFEFDITDAARAGETNRLAVEIFPPQPDDLALSFVDWNPAPPDKNMGLWQDVYITTSGDATLRYPQVTTHFTSASLDAASLTVGVEVGNASDHRIEGTLRGRIPEAGVRFERKVALAPGETRFVSFAPGEFRQLTIRNPRVWFPIRMGAHPLYDLELEFDTGGAVSDRLTKQFGIREVTSELDANNHRLFRVNGKPILIRGAGWTPDMLLRYDAERMEDELTYVRDMGLNAVRLEGKLEPESFFDLADRMGLLVIAGWCCCDHWEHWERRADYAEGPVWDAEDERVAALSLADQVRRLRIHPSVFLWMNGSDNPPPARIERMYIDVLEKNRWQNPYLSSATAKPSQVTGTSGVKMEGPYDYVPPGYWLADEKYGGAHGFATEVCPGASPPPIESLRKFLPAEGLTPGSDLWNFRAGGGQFKNTKFFDDALAARYGAPRSTADYLTKAQAMTYDNQRAMMEAFGRNKYEATGVIQWMLNNAWASVIWHLYDYYLLPAGGYFGTKKACEPVHAQYSYDDRSVAVVNNTYEPHAGLRLTARVFDTEMRERFTKSATIDLASDAVARPFVIPEIADLSAAYFLDLRLTDRAGKLVSANLYWLSTRPDVLDWSQTTWYHTPVTQHADLTALQNLPPVRLESGLRVTRRGAEETAHVTLANPSRTALAFLVRLQIKRGRDGDEIVPVRWSDNYISLLPGERRELVAEYRAKDAGGVAPVLAVGGWNVPTTTRDAEAQERQRSETRR